MSKLDAVASTLKALESLRDAMRTPLGTVVTGVVADMSKGMTFNEAIDQHVHVEVATLDGGKVTLGDVIDSLFGTDEPVDSRGGAPRPEAEGAGAARSEETATMFPREE